MALIDIQNKERSIALIVGEVLTSKSFMKFCMEKCDTDDKEYVRDYFRNGGCTTLAYALKDTIQEVLKGQGNLEVILDIPIEEDFEDYNSTLWVYPRPLGRIKTICI